MQHGLHVNVLVPRGGKIKCDAKVPEGDRKHCRGKSHGVYSGTLVVQEPPVDLIAIFPRPQANVAELPQADAAAHKVLVGVQDQVQQMLMRRHGEKAVDLDRANVRNEVVQLVVGVLGGIE